MHCNVFTLPAINNCIRCSYNLILTYFMHSDRLNSFWNFFYIIFIKKFFQCTLIGLFIKLHKTGQLFLLKFLFIHPLDINKNLKCGWTQ